MSTYVVAAVAFGLATVFGIKLRDDVTVPTAAALAPPLALSMRELSTSEGTLLLVGPLIALLILILAGRALLEIVSHMVLLLATSGLILLVLPREVTSSFRALAYCLVLTFGYSVAETGRQKLSNDGPADLGEDRTIWWVLQGVLLCACGLTVLVVDRMGWPAFVVMAAVLVITKREFDAFGKSRTAYDQTVRALERLAERADREKLVST